MATEVEQVSLKEFMIETMKERDHRYEQRFIIIDRHTQDALAMANENIRAALTALD